MSTWNNGDHPRQGDGRFAVKGGLSPTSATQASLRAQAFQEVVDQPPHIWEAEGAVDNLCDEIHRERHVGADWSSEGYREALHAVDRMQERLSVARLTLEGRAGVGRAEGPDPVRDLMAADDPYDDGPGGLRDEWGNEDMGRDIVGPGTGVFRVGGWGTREEYGYRGEGG